jgi:WD40 repeat protein
MKYSVSSRFFSSIGMILTISIMVGYSALAQGISGDPALVLGPVGQLLRAVYSPTGNLIVTAGGDSLVRFWGSSDGARSPEYDVRVTKCANVQFFPDGDHILYTDYPGQRLYDTTVKWHWRERRRVWAIHAHYAAMSSDGAIIVAAIDSGGDTKFWMVDPVTGALSRPFGSYDPNEFISMQISSDRRRLVYQEGPGKSVLYDIETGSTIAMYDFGNPTFTARFAPNDSLILFSASTPLVVNPGNGDTVLKLEQQLGRTYDASYSPDGKYIATLSIDWGVRLWDGATGKFVTLLGRQSSIGYSLEFSPDGKHIVTTSVDGKAFVWTVPEGPSGVANPEREMVGTDDASLYPNPAISEAHIKYSVPHSAIVHIRLLDCRGAVVTSLLEKVREPGEYFERLDLDGVPSGVYFCEIGVAGKRVVRALRVER